MRRIAGAALFAVALGGCAVAGYFTLHPPLAKPLAASLARALALRPDQVVFGSARLVAPATLELGAVRVAEARADRIAIGVDPFAAIMGGHPRPRSLVVEGLSLGAVSARRLEASFGAGGRARLTVRGIAFRRAGLPVAIDELGVEIEGGRVQRIAFAGAELGAGQPRALAGALAGTATRDPAGGWRLRAARTGLTLAGRIEHGALTARAELKELPLQPIAPLGRRFGVALDRAAASGAFTVRLTADELRAEGRIGLTALSIDHRAVSRDPIGPIALELDGAVGLVRGALTVDRLKVGLGPVQAIFSGGLSRSGAFLTQARLPATDCNQLLSALPPELVPALAGLTLEGTIGGHGELSGDLAELASVRLGVHLDLGCRVLADPPRADVTQLVSGEPALPHAVDAHGRPRRFLLGPDNPSWRPLSELPTSIVRAFLISEDGRFFVHHGFDLEMIRRALIADLGVDRFDRGASTLTQQLVKNLYLSGERTVTRKLEEAVLAWRLEQVVSKRRILELYLNLAELGPGIYGISEGAERYFGKEPEELSLNEAAELAALLPAPRRGMDAAWRRRYQALAARLPSEKLVIPPLAKSVAPAGPRLTRR
ncbi:MAG TPA: biosynthetic peptidoglycan transglycosylase [Polyangia bacterium]